MNAAEDRLSQLMDAATRALAPPVESILAEGARLGRRRRRRRRAAVAAGTAAVVLVGGAGTVAGLRLARTDHRQTVGVAGVVHQTSRPPTSAAPTSLGPAPTSAFVPVSPASPAKPTAPTTDGVEPITSQAALEILVKNGANGWKISPYSPKSNSAASLLDIDVDDGNGTARILVGIASTADSGMDPADCASQNPLLVDGGKRPPGAPSPSCVVRHYQNGDKVMQEVLGADAYGEYEYRVIAYRADGVALEITAANGDNRSPATEVTRVLPPLSLARWAAIALQRSWQLTVPYYAAKVTPTP